MAATMDNGLSSDSVVHAGFIPLTDCAALVIARELAFDRRYGIDLRLHREVSWANIRDKVDIGALDCAHMLAPMPIAAALGLGRAAEPIIAPMSLSLGGTAITISNRLYDEMLTLDQECALAGGMAAARSLAAVVRNRQAAGGEPLTLGMVFPFSSHNYDMRFWLAHAGIDPDNDVNLVVIPPPLQAESLASGRVDGFCVGAPWGSVSVAAGGGRIIATKSELWPRAPEKVLGVRKAWAEQNPDLLRRLMQGLVEAARWLDEPANRLAAATILARPEYVGVPEPLLARALCGGMERGLGTPVRQDPEFLVFHRHDANFPWCSHAVWFMTQMIRWGQVRQAFDLRKVAESVYRPDLYRAAIHEIGLPVPAIDYKSEGVLDAGSSGAGFFERSTFDPAAVMAYVKGLEIRASSVSLEAFAALNP